MEAFLGYGVEFDCVLFAGRLNRGCDGGCDVADTDMAGDTEKKSRHSSHLSAPRNRHPQKKKRQVTSAF
jgi:hypothetical protein